MWQTYTLLLEQAPKCKWVSHYGDSIAIKIIALNFMIISAN